MQRWYETRQMLSDLLAWLDETQQWAAAVETSEIVAVGEVSQNRSASASAIPAAAATEALPPASEVPGGRPDLFALLAALTALRQEVKLQTRAARNDREQAAGALDQLANAVTQCERLQQEENSRRDAAVQGASRLAIETLVELHDALSRSARQAERILASVGATLRAWSVQPEACDGAADSASPRLGEAADSAYPVTVGAGMASASGSGAFPWLRRWFGRPVEPSMPASIPATIHETFVSPLVPKVVTEMRQIKETAAHMADRLDGLAAGVLLNVQRLERALAVYGVEPVECLGQPVDSEIMEVVQIVTDPAYPSGVVSDEVRRGYRRHGQVYRVAQVVVTRATPQTASAPFPTAIPDGPDEATGP